MRIPENVKAKLFRTVDRLADETLRLTSDLVKIPSENPSYIYTKEYFEKGYTKLYEAPVTFGGEKKVNEFLEPLLKGLGAETVYEAKHPLRPNLIGIFKGNGNGRSLALNAHVDTVPTGPHEEWKWNDPFSGKIEDGKIYGRGSTDDKVCVACIIKAVEAIYESGCKLKGELQIHTTVGEETAEGKTHGPGWFIQNNKRYKTDACIVAEGSAPPYRLGIASCSGGASWLNITVKGKPVHASQRYRTIRSGYEGEEIGVNAIDKAYKIYRALRDLEEEWAITKKDSTGLMPDGFATIPIGWMYGHPGGTEIPFLLADHCEIGMAVWRNPMEKFEDVQKEVETVIRNAADSDSWLRKNPPKVEWKIDWPPFWIDKEHPLTKVVENAYLDVIGPPPRYMAWQPVSDARFYQENGVPSILIGPGEYRVAHAYNEYCPIDQIPDALKIYALAAMEWCGYE